MSEQANDPSGPKSSRVARWAALLGVASVSIVAVGILGIQVGLLAPMAGFGLFALGAVLGGLATGLLGVIGWFTSGGGDADGRRNAMVALAIAVVLVGSVMVGGSPGRGLPRINDITTDLGDPPVFVAALEEPANAGRDMSYPPDFAPQVRAAYPDLTPIQLAIPAPEAFDRSLAVAESLGWEITRRDREAGVFEARDVTAVFRFVDDIVVRVRSLPGRTLVDMRSKSRDGQGDVGANAARIRRFTAALRAEVEG